MIISLREPALLGSRVEGVIHLRETLRVRRSVFVKIKLEFKRGMQRNFSEALTALVEINDVLPAKRRRGSVAGGEVLDDPLRLYHSG